MLSLATCQTQKETSETENSSPKAVVVKENSTTPVKENMPEKSVVLPVDKESQANADQDIVDMKNGMITLKEGQNKFVKELGMNVTFKKVVEDSRCPKDVNCVWEGAATVELEVMGLETRPMTMKLSTVNQGTKYSKVQQFNGYDISLDQLTPGTTSERGMKQLQGTYQIVLKFNKAGSNPVQKK